MLFKAKLICCYFRILMMKIIYSSSRIEVDGFSNINNKTIIEVGKKCILKIGPGLHNTGEFSVVCSR